MSKVKIYLRGKLNPIELEGMGTDRSGHWEIMISFKETYVYIQRKWRTGDTQALYTIPRQNLFYVDWGNWANENNIEEE
jgi:hypothetical protein